MPPKPRTPVELSKQLHDQERQGRAHLVRLTPDLQAKANRIKGTRSVSGLLRDLLEAAPDKKR